MTNGYQGWMGRGVAWALAVSLIASSGCSTTSGEAGKARVEAREHYDADVARLGEQQARQDFEVGNLKSALYNIEGAISLNPEEAQYRILKARVLIELNRLDPALAELNRAVSLNPRLPDAHYFAGLIYQRWSEHDQAFNEYHAALQMAPENPDYMLATVETLITQRRLEEAQSTIDAHRAYFSNNAALRRAEGHLALLNNEPAVAAEHFHKAMLLVPDDKSLVELLAIAYLKAGNASKAEFYLDQLLSDEEYAQRLDLQHLRAMCLVAQNELVKARPIYLELTRQDASNPDYWFEFGSLCLELGDASRARQIVSRVVTVWPDRFESFLLRGMLHERNGEKTAAVKDYRRACTLDPRHEQSFVLLGVCLSSMGKTDEAEDAFSIARMINPESAGQETDRTLAGVEPPLDPD